MEYSDGTLGKVGDVVMGGHERYVVLGSKGGNFANLLLIGTVNDEKSFQFGHTIILPTGFTRSAPLSDFTRLGYADIAVREYPAQ